MTQLGLFDRPARYPHKPGFKRRDTSEAAADAIQGRASTLRAAALSEIEKAPDLTADEVASKLGESVLAIRPRITELARMGCIADSEKRRPNASGRRAIAWRFVRRETVAA